VKRYENLEDALCKELEMLDKKYGGDTAEMTVQDVEKADKLYHALKSAETYHAMAEAGMDEDEESGDGRGYRGRSYGSYGRSYGGRSYARRRDMMGRFSGGYDDGYSGHYPPMMPYGRDDWQY
jgi:hypothetical protein